MQTEDFFPLDTCSNMFREDLNWMRKLAVDNELRRDEQMSLLSRAIEDSRSETDVNYARWLEEGQIEDAQRYDAVYLHTQRTGLIFSTYAMLEAHIHEECQFCRARFSCRLKPAEIANRGLRRSSLYLQKVVGCEPSIFKSEFDTMHLLGDLRNVLAHNNGKVPEDRSKLLDQFRQYARKHSNSFCIETDDIKFGDEVITRSNKVVLNSSSVNHFIDMSEALVAAVGRAIVDRTQRQAG